MLSPADLLAFAAKQSSSEASRYAHAAEVARARGNHELAQLLGILAERQPAAGEVNDREAERVRRLLPPALAEADAAMEEAIGSALLTPYRHWRWRCRRRKEFSHFAHIAALVRPADPPRR